MANTKRRIAILISGSGSNLQAIINAIKAGKIENSEISVVISNKKEAFGLKRAEKEKIANLHLSKKDFPDDSAYDKKLIEILKNDSIELIVLAGYLKILTPNFIKEFKNKIINIHPSLLPKFGGKGMYGKYVHEAVLKSSESESGCTVHFVTEGIDEGDIICQSKVKVLPNDTVDTLAKRVLEEEHKLLIDGINKVLNKKYTYTNQI